MTRINVVPVEILTDKHLLAEYKEITRPFNKVITRIEKYGVDKALDSCVIPSQYTLGKGHESFFFNKLEWLHSRYCDLAQELVEREFKIDIDKFNNIAQEFSNKLRCTKYWNWYKPTPQDFYLNMARLVKRCNVPWALIEYNQKD